MRIRGDAGTGLHMPDGGGAVRAKRLDVTPWRDPRLIAGILLVVVSAALGGWLMAAADQTESFWAVGSDVRGGDPVRRADLVAVRAKVPGETSAALLRTSRTFPDRLVNLRWATDAQAGTFVTEDLLASRRAAVELPIAVGVGSVPGDLRQGDRVDVWSIPESGARRLLRGVRVVARSTSTGITGGPGITVVVDIAGTTVDSKLMNALNRGHITVVRVS
jgi:hypothetical protein